LEIVSTVLAWFLKRILIVLCYLNRNWGLSVILPFLDKMNIGSSNPRLDICKDFLGQFHSTGPIMRFAIPNHIPKQNFITIVVFVNGLDKGRRPI